MSPSRFSHVPAALSLLVLLSRPALAQESAAPPAPPADPPEPARQVVDLDHSFLVPQQSGGAGGEGDHGAVSHTPGVIFTSDGRRMITATSTDEIVIFDAATRKILKRFKIPGDGHDGVSIDPGGRYAAWVMKKAGVIVMDLETGEVVKRDDNLQARWVAIDPDGRRIALSRGKVIEIRELRTLKLLSTLEGHEADVTNLSWSTDGQRLGSTAQDGRILVHHVEKKRIDHRAKKGAALHALAFSPDGKLIAFGGMDQQIYVYDFSREKETILTKDTVQPYWITCLGFSPDGKRLAVGDESCDIWLYDMASGKRIFHNKHHIECWLGSVAWAPDNETFLFGCRPNTLSQVPATYQALAQAEAARDDEVRASRERLLAKIDAELTKVTDDAVRSSLEAYRKVLDGETKVQSAPGLFQIAGNLPQVADEQVFLNSAQQIEALPQQAATPQLAQNVIPIPAPSPIATFSLDLAETFNNGAPAIEKLPPELKKLASAHRELLEKKMSKLNKDNFCINQWKVK